MFQLKARFLRLLLTTLVCLSGCTGDQSLRMGIIPWIGYEPVYLARDLGWLPPGVTLVEGENAGESLDRLIRGEIDAAALTLDELLMARAAGVPVETALVFNVSMGADKLLAKPGIESVEQLAGKVIAVESAAVGMLTLTKALEIHGLSLADVNIRDLPPNRHLEAWQDPTIDAVVTYEPTATRLERLGAVPIFDSREMPDMIFDVLAVHPGRTTDGQVTALIEAHFRALEHMRTNRQDAMFRIAARQEVSMSELHEIIGGVAMPDLQGNRYYLEAPGRLQQKAEELHDFMRSHKLLKNPAPLNNSATPAYLPR